MNKIKLLKDKESIIVIGRIKPNTNTEHGNILDLSTYNEINYKDPKNNEIMKYKYLFFIINLLDYQIFMDLKVHKEKYLDNQFLHH